jgi:hypothetical protein
MVLNLTVAIPGAAQVPLQQAQKLRAPVPGNGDAYGVCVSISGDRAVVGAPGDDANGTGSGAAHILRRSGESWVHERTLRAFDGAFGDGFGGSVAISGDTVVVGAIYDDDQGPNSGSAYVYRWDGTGWRPEQKLVASDGTLDRFFGKSVSISGEAAIVSGGGAAYVFRRSGVAWAEEQRLEPPDPARNGVFGAVSISGDVAIIGTPRDAENGGSAGAAHVFSRIGTEWRPDQKLLASDGEAADAFGISVSIHGNRAIVGAWEDGDNGRDSGSAYVYRHEGGVWMEEQKLLPLDGKHGDFFGVSVSITGDAAVVGSHMDDDGGTASGSAYAFRRNGHSWLQEQKLLASDGAAGDLFGYSVSASGHTVIVGASGDDCTGVDDSCGAAYLFSSIGGGAVDLGSGSPADVLFVNFSSGGLFGTVSVPVGSPLTFSLVDAPAGPTRTSYVLWVWPGFPDLGSNLGIEGELLGRTVNPTPFHASQGRQPILCLVGANVPGAACAGVISRSGPARVPWTIRRPGLSRPAVFTLQGVVRDNGAANALGASVTNAVVLRVE